MLRMDCLSMAKNNINSIIGATPLTINKIVNSVNMINNLSLGIGLEYINKFNIDYNWKTYKDIYYQVCSYKNLEPTDCIIFGSGGEEYKEYNRGSYINRVCISDLIGKEINAK